MSQGKTSGNVFDIAKISILGAYYLDKLFYVTFIWRTSQIYKYSQKMRILLKFWVNILQGAMVVYNCFTE